MVNSVTNLPFIDINFYIRKTESNSNQYPNFQISNFEKNNLKLKLNKKIHISEEVTSFYVRIATLNPGFSI